jgi:NAD(P)-dependent dehydrogenase (short-subunit alcohol dehydrogenase family)
MAERLDARTALITGGAGALGRRVVKRFLEAGATVHVPLVADEDPTPLAELLGDAISAVHLHHDADLTDPDAVSTVFSQVEGTSGSPPDILLNLAGGFSHGAIEDTDPSDWMKMYQINATTAFLCSRSAFPAMRAAGWGRIVNVSALPAHHEARPGFSAYASAKAAVLQLTRTLAREGIGAGITVNAVLPSIIDTPGNRAAMPDADRSRWLPPERIAAVLHFLSSDAGGIVNGAAIPLTLGDP